MMSVDIVSIFVENKLAFAIRSCTLERRKFQKSIERTNYSERLRYRGRYLSSFSAFPTAAMWTGFVHVLYP